MAAALTLEDPVTAVPGVGTRLGERLEEAFGIRTVGDLIAYVPYTDPGRYLERPEVKALADTKVGEAATIVGRLTDWEAFKPRRKRKGGRKSPEHIARATIADDAGGRITAPFFNQPWLPQRVPTGTRVAVSGKLERYRGRLQLGSARIVARGADALPSADDGDALTGTYPATAEIASERIAKAVRAALDRLPPLEDPLPERLRRAHGLVDRDTAVRHIHRPPDRDAARRARARLVYDELLALQLGVQRRRQHRQETEGGLAQPPVRSGWADRFLAGLPFEPTAAQRRAIAELAEDLGAARPMHRLLQGDVGSGKTLVAAWAMLTAVDHGRQAALMAPTELLAEQHLGTLLALLSPLGAGGPGGPRVELVTRSVTGAKLRKLLAEIAAGDVDVLVGTHALLEERVAPHDLGLVVIDEQHRFGVEHRVRLRAKRAPAASADDGESASHPDVLVMTATPIPRSLALTMYGDLDVTELDELPPGRQPVTTSVIGSASPRRARVEAYLRECAAAGERAYVVCPAVDASEEVVVTDGGETRSIANAEETYRRLSTGPLADVGVGLVHGRLKATAREEVMDAFRRGEIQVLVATTVIEVGVDVPEATLMIVEDADRFGISQLHQLRGRVGRGEVRSFCVLFTTDPDNARLQALASTSDGFELAETDMELRGEGSLFDTRQSGLPDLRVARLVRDAQWVARTREDARALLAGDPDLAAHPLLAAEVASRFDVDRLAALDSG